MCGAAGPGDDDFEAAGLGAPGILVKAVRRAVRERDGDQCAFVNARGRRCKARAGLELHHKQPFGRGGDHNPDNIQMTCRAHNAYLAEQDYGKDLMNKYRRSSQVSEPAPIYYVPRNLRMTHNNTPGAPATWLAEL